MVVNTIEDIISRLVIIGRFGDVITGRFGNGNTPVLINEGQFSELTRNSDRVKVVTDILRQNDLLPEVKLPVGKSLEKSLDLRNAGNRAFKKKDDKGALLLYTKSIAEAPFPKNVEMREDENAVDALAIALANRSAVLFSMGKYELCLRDILQALKYNYPHRLLYKLYERQGKCLQYLGKKKEATESIDNALKWLSSATGLSEDRKETIEKELQKLLKCFQNANANVKLPNYELPELPTCSYNKNLELPCASDCMELKYSPEMGRYISATRDIKPGDVLVVEEPFASVLNIENFETHCYNCLQRCEALLPCCFCPNVMYCSEECRSSSWNASHFIDCSLLPTLQKLNINETCFLVLKIVIMACKNKDLKNMLVSLEAEENLEQRNRGFNSKGQYSSSDYSPVYWLVGHTEKRDVKELILRSVLAACILHCLESMTDFFSDIDINQFKYEIGGLILRHLQNLSCNVHEISEFCLTTNAKSMEGQISGWENRKVGVAVYATLSLFNHSCERNMSRVYYRGDTAVLRALHSIAAGDQIVGMEKWSLINSRVIFGIMGSAKLFNDSCLKKKLHLGKWSRIAYWSICPLYSISFKYMEVFVYINEFQPSRYLKADGPPNDCYLKGFKPKIFDDYGHDHIDHGKTERRSYFESHYYFTCRCIACMEDWPTISSLLGTISTFICNRCKHVLRTRLDEVMDNNTTTCAICKKAHNLQETWVKIKLSTADLFHNKQLLAGKDGTDFNKLAQRMIPHLLLLDENIKQPSSDHIWCLATIMQCFSMTGNCYKQ